MVRVLLLLDVLALDPRFLPSFLFSLFRQLALVAGLRGKVAVATATDAGARRASAVAGSRARLGASQLFFFLVFSVALA